MTVTTTIKKKKQTHSEAKKELARRCVSAGMSWRLTSLFLRVNKTSIGNWVSPKRVEVNKAYAEANAAEIKAYRRKHFKVNREHQASLRREDRQLNPEKWRAIYEQSYNRPAEKARIKGLVANRRILKTNTPEFVFLDNTWMEVDRRETYRVFKDELLPLMERVHIKQMYLEAQKLTEETGIEYHIDHIQPLSKGGEHLTVNLQLLPVAENLAKSNTFRPEDQIELCRRLFNPTPEYTQNEHLVSRYLQAA